MYIYNYVTTNKITGKRYVGMHKTNKLKDRYLGGGDLLKAAIKKYGSQNFERKILFFCDSEKEAHLNERKIIELLGTIKPFGYNISPLGGGPKQPPLGIVPWNKGKKGLYTPSEETKIRLSKANKGRKREPFSEETLIRMKETHNTPEYKEKMRQIAKNRPKRKLSEKHKESIRRAMQTEEARRRMSEIKNSKTQEEKHEIFLKGIETRLKNGSILPGEVERDEKGKFLEKKTA
jgi:hypothetical protein